MTSPCAATPSRCPIDTVIGMDLKLPAAVPSASSSAGPSALGVTDASAADFAIGLASAMNAAASGGVNSPLASVLPPTQATTAPPVRVPAGTLNFSEAIGALKSLFAEFRNPPAPATATASQSGVPPTIMKLLAPEHMPETVNILGALLAPDQRAAVSLENGRSARTLPQGSVEHAVTEPAVSLLAELVEKIAARPGSPEPILATKSGADAQSSNEQGETPSAPADLLGWLFAMNLAPPLQPQVSLNLAVASTASTLSSSLPVTTAQTTSPTQIALAGQGGASSPLAALFPDKAGVAAATAHSAEFIDSLVAQIGTDPASSPASSMLRTASAYVSPSLTQPGSAGTSTV